MFGPLELLLLLIVVLLIFGARKLPELGSAFGESIKNFKKTTREADVIDVSSDEAEQRSEGGNGKRS